MMYSLMFSFSFEAKFLSTFFLFIKIIIFKGDAKLSDEIEFPVDFLRKRLIEINYETLQQGDEFIISAIFIYYTQKATFHNLQCFVKFMLSII